MIFTETHVTSLNISSKKYWSIATKIITGFEITKKNHCGGVMFEHSFNRKPKTMLRYLHHSDFSS